MMLIEYERTMLIIDAGLMFPEDYMPGVDVVIPDIQYLRENRDRVHSIILTHGHEDHIGALPFLIKELDRPVYGTSFTIKLLQEKLKEHKLTDEVVLRTVKAGDVSRFGPFSVEFIRVNHSIVDGVGLAIETPAGIIVHSGDFKIDQTPLDGQGTDLIRFAHYGEKDVLALLSDSTNVEKEGFTQSESDVKKTLDTLFRACEGRLIVAVFASNILRIRQIIELAAQCNRKVLFSGKSMITNIRIAREEGIIRIPPGTEIKEHEINRLPDNEVAIITTGSQGEPMSALTRMARDRHKGIKIRKGDTIILSSRFIPGNEKAITSIINKLYRLGAEVIYEKVSQIHSSGHAYKEELKMMLNLVKPRYFIPIHGEYRHLVKHIRLAVETGIPPEKALLAENGDTICFSDGGAKILDRVHTGRILVDGKGVGDVGELVLRERRRLAGDGVVIALLALDEQTGEIIYGPDIISRGFVFEDQGGVILEQAKDIVLEVLNAPERTDPIEGEEVAPDIKRNLKRFFYKIIERRPIIMPIIITL